MRDLKSLLALSLWTVISLCLSVVSAVPNEPTIEKKNLIVAISNLSPFVIIEDNIPVHGFSIDLWNAVAKTAGLDFEFKAYEGVQAKLEALRNKEVDIAIGGISQTAEREKEFDFSHPSYYSGLDIMLKKQGQDDFWGMFKNLFFDDNKFLFKGLIFSGIVFVVLAGHLIWLAEKGKDSFSDNYFYGVGQGIYWVIVTGSTVGYGDFHPKRPLGRVVTILIIILALPLFGIFISQLSATLTTIKIHGYVQGPNDLHQKQVGVVSNTTSESSAQRHNLNYRIYPNMKAATQALNQDQIDALIYDAPALQHFVKHNPESADLRVVGNLFDHQILAFASLNRNPLMENINHALLSVRESGRYDALKQEWFK